MVFLNATNPQTIKFMRSAMVDVGFKAQRLANKLFKRLARKQTEKPPATKGAAPIKEQVIHFINKKMPGGLPKKTARALLDIEDKDYVPIIRNPKATTADTEAVFYFPGCGSERLFSQVGLATQAMLWHAGVQTVLPPGYLCCGYPQKGSGQFDKADKIITDNRVLFHRVANTLNYLDIKTVVVSCGTCYDQLQGYEFDKIFPGSRIIDIHEYLLEKGITLRPENGAGKGYLFHAPCHSPMKLQEPMKTVKALLGDNVLQSERCCGESGTLGVTRPDISTQVRFRKEEELQKGEAQLRASGAVSEQQNVKILTSCPSCLQGLSRYQDDMKNGLLEADYIVVEMANQMLGCPLCDADGGLLVFRNEQLRVIQALEAGFPAFYRVVWNTHVAEFSDLSEADRNACMNAVLAVEQVLREQLQPTKINLAAPGNAVPHLHWHVIARFDWDSHFPGPVWAAAQRPNNAEKLAKLASQCAQINHLLAETLAS
eukprot:gene37786-49498_t